MGTIRIFRTKASLVIIGRIKDLNAGVASISYKYVAVRRAKNTPLGELNCLSPKPTTAKRRL